MGLRNNLSLISHLSPARARLGVPRRYIAQAIAYENLILPHEASRDHLARFPWFARRTVVPQYLDHTHIRADVKPPVLALTGKQDVFHRAVFFKYLALICLFHCLAHFRRYFLAGGDDGLNTGREFQPLIKDKLCQ